MSYRWIKNYERSRFKESKEPNESWVNSRYGPQNMNWSDAQQVYLPSLKMCIGPAWFHLRKLWEKYKRNNRIGESNSDIAYQINLYQKNLDLPRTQFEELEAIVSEHEFEDSSESLEPRPSNLEEILTREEAQAEAEAEAELDRFPMIDLADLSGYFKYLEPFKILNVENIDRLLKVRIRGRL